jgi:hypothetical protein
VYSCDEREKEEEKEGEVQRVCVCFYNERKGNATRGSEREGGIDRLYNVREAGKE